MKNKKETEKKLEEEINEQIFSVYEELRVRHGEDADSLRKCFVHLFCELQMQRDLIQGICHARELVFRTSCPEKFEQFLEKSIMKNEILTKKLRLNKIGDIITEMDKKAFSEKYG